MIQERDDIVALDSAIILNPQVWVASGHVGGFSDPLVDCRTCKLRFRADHLETSALRPAAVEAPRRDAGLRPHRAARVQPDVRDAHRRPCATTPRVAYLRPETAQGIFVNFKNVTSSLRVKPPFGIAQIGKSFRNEITPGNFLFRVREFEQMEMEFFVPPADADEWYEYWIERARALAPRPRPARERTCASARTTRTSSRTTRARRATSSTCSRSAGRSSRASRTAATTTCASTPRLRHEARVDRPRGALRPVRDRAGRSASTAPRSRSSSTPTTRRSSPTGRAPCCASTRASRP